ncbi:hypothetical protein Ciccas_011499 [Cichlidogyrus casuarinus]|uniref:Uncharacterized protein n=1 Tax=Cichlidogyrus casuarinus TaxID=1844966 RepID=A0ABD2PS90_9PLAT
MKAPYKRDSEEFYTSETAFEERKPYSHPVSDIDLVRLEGQSSELREEMNKDYLDYWQLLAASVNHIGEKKLSTQLLQFLQVWWAADWLMGSGRAPDGLRCSFYRRLTLDKLSLCLKLIRKFEARYSVMLATRMFAATAL